MKTILNKTNGPLKIRLSRGKTLRIGPGKEGQIATLDGERESVKKLIEAGNIEVVSEGTQVGAGSKGDTGGHPNSRGHHPSMSGRSRGDR
jgi:hypothetical protein